MSDKKPRGLVSSETRAGILQAAGEVLVEHEGEIEMSQVAKRAGVSVGLAYHYFGSKAGLLSALIGDFYDRYDAVANRRYDRDVAWAVRERQRLDALVAFLCGDPLAPVMLARMSGNAEVVATESARQREMVAVAARNISDGQRRGEISESLDPKVAGAAVIGGIRLAIAQALADKKRPSRTKLARQLWSFIAGGLQLDVVDE